MPAIKLLHTRFDFRFLVLATPELQLQAPSLPARFQRPAMGKQMSVLSCSQAEYHSVMQTHLFALKRLYLPAEHAEVSGHALLE